MADFRHEPDAPCGPIRLWPFPAALDQQEWKSDNQKRSERSELNGALVLHWRYRDRQAQTFVK
jgi:hypothetical protein